MPKSLPKSFRVATWNINSLRLRQGLLPDLIGALDPDVICLQETKCPDEFFPLHLPAAIGFPHVLFRGMKGYNGVATFSKRPIRRHETTQDWVGRNDCRHLAVELDAPGGPLGETSLTPRSIRSSPTSSTSSPPRGIISRSPLT